MESFTSHPLVSNPMMGYTERDMAYRPKIKIGHDVWLGANVIILPSVRNIGNGACIGAGSIVTKDVEPYSIMAGNPAKKLRMRFNPAQISYLENLRWWEKNYEELKPLIPEIQKKLDSLKNQD